MVNLGIDVSRETMERLQTYQSLLAQWTKAINLISPSTSSDIWNRHIRDSAQIFPHVPATAISLIDIGSGGGLPGIVIAALAAEKAPDLSVTLVESDQRKVAFLRTAAREMGLKIQVLATRVESLKTVSCDVLTARALAPLDDLLGYAALLLRQNGSAIFQKGRNFEAEIAAASVNWDFNVTEYESNTSAEARILLVKGISRVA